MEETPFVGRKKELQGLRVTLNEVINGRGRVLFIRGEAGAGKSTLLHEFARQGQEKNDRLVVAAGICNSYTGAGDPYLPFREVLGVLVGGAESQAGKTLVPPQNKQRVRGAAARAGALLLELAPTLIETFFPALGLASAIGSLVLEQAGLKDKLEDIYKKQKTEKQAAPSPSLNQENIFEQYTHFLLKLSSETPLLLILDDVQWADESSLGLLFHLGRRIRNAPVLIVCTFRSDEVAAGRGGDRHPLEKVLAEFKRDYGDIVIELDPQSGQVDCTLVDALLDTEPNQYSPAFRRQMCRHTQANPLFVLELLREMQAKGSIIKNQQGVWADGKPLDWNAYPARVQGVIEERINRLDPVQRRLLSTASIQGEQFIAEIVARMNRLVERDLVQVMSEELGRRHRLVTPAGMQRSGSQRISLYHFYHQLFQKYLYGELDEAARSYLHEEVGDLLESVYADEIDAAVPLLAWHYTEAGLHSKGAGYLLRAGELAAASYANAEAVHYFSHGLEIVPVKDFDLHFALLLGREGVYSRLGNRALQADDLRDLEHLASTSKSEAKVAESDLRWANFYLDTGDYPAAQQRLQNVIDLAGKASLPALEVQAYALLGLALYHRSEYGEAREWLDLAQEMAETAGDQALLARIAYYQGLADYGQDHYEDASLHFETALQAYRQMEDGKGEINCLLMIGTIASQRGDHLHTLRLLEQALVKCRQIGWRRGETYLLGNIGGVQLDIGDLGNAIRNHQQALEICREVGDREGEAVSLDTLGVAQARGGEFSHAIDHFETALAIDRTIGYRRGEGYVLTHLGYTLLDFKRYSKAEEAFQKALEIRRNLDSNSGTAMDDLAGLARAALEQENYDRALAYAREIQGWIRTNDPLRTEYPVQIYLILYQVFAVGSKQKFELASEARAALEAGYQILTTQLEKLDEPQARQNYLSRVPFNADLSAAWQKVNQAPLKSTG